MKNSLSDFLGSIGSSGSGLPPSLAALLAQSAPGSNSAINPAAQTDATSPFANMNPQDLQELIQQLQQGGANTNGQNAVQGSPGSDPIASGTPDGQAQSSAPQSLQDALTNMASGQGGVDYNAIQNSYPRSQMQEPQSIDALRSQFLRNDPSDSIGGALNKARGYAEDTQRAQQGAIIAQQNKDNLAAYQAAFSAAQQAGKTQHEAAALAEEAVRDKNNATYQQGQLSIGQQNADTNAQLKDAQAGYYANIKGQTNEWEPLKGQTTSDGHLILVNKKTGETKVDRSLNLKNLITRPLDAAKQKAITNSLNDLLSEKNEDTGKMMPFPFDTDQKEKIKAEAARRYQSGDAASAPEAVTSVINDLGGLGALIDQTKPGRWYGTNKTGLRQFPDISSIAGKVAAPATIGDAVAPAASPQVTAPGMGMQPAMIEQKMKQAISQGATPEQIQMMGQKLGVSVDPKTGTVTPMGWQ